MFSTFKPTDRKNSVYAIFKTNHMIYFLSSKHELVSSFLVPIKIIIQEYAKLCNIIITRKAITFCKVR